MPCRGPDPDPFEDQRTIDKLREENDRLTRMLCELTARIPVKYLQADDELHGWVLEHLEADKKRRADEVKRKEQNRKSLKAQIAKLQKELKDNE